MNSPTTLGNNEPRIIPTSPINGGNVNMSVVMIGDHAHESDNRVFAVALFVFLTIGEQRSMNADVQNGMRGGTL